MWILSEHSMYDQSLNRVVLHIYPDILIYIEYKHIDRQVIIEETILKNKNFVKVFIGVLFVKSLIYEKLQKLG